MSQGKVLTSMADKRVVDVYKINKEKRHKEKNLRANVCADQRKPTDILVVANFRACPYPGRSAEKSLFHRVQGRLHPYEKKKKDLNHKEREEVKWSWPPKIPSSWSLKAVLWTFIICGQRNLSNVIQFRYGAKVIISADPECNHRCPYQEEAKGGLTKEEKQCDLRHYKCATGFIEGGAKAKVCKENSWAIRKTTQILP